MTSLFPLLQDQKLYRDAMAIREWLCELSGLIPRLNEDPNSFYGNTLSGLTLIEYYGGPSAVGTPFGTWACTGGGSLKNRHWREEATERLGLVVSMPETNTSEGTHGPIWKITKNLDGEPIFTEAKSWISFPGIKGSCYLESLNLSLETIRAEIEPRLDKMREERTASFFAGGREKFAMRENTTAHMLLWDLYNVTWHEMKKAIGFVAWDDRVDPVYYPHSCYVQSNIDEHLESIGFDAGSLTTTPKTKIFGVTGADAGKTEYIVVCQDYPQVIERIICPDLREPTAEEKQMVAKILKARGFVWKA